jgi:hypothetical protein
MERLDGDGALARVSYLPGVLPPPPVEQPSSRSITSASPAPQAIETDAEPAPGAARHVSITALARRGLSRRELERHLRDRGFDDDEIEAEVARLERDGYIDDIALAQNLVGTLQERGAPAERVPRSARVRRQHDPCGGRPGAAVVAAPWSRIPLSRARR